jgi:hypothetical protein
MANFEDLKEIRQDEPEKDKVGNTPTETQSNKPTLDGSGWGCFVLLGLIFLAWHFFYGLFEANYKYSIAMPNIAGYFIKNDEGFTANGIYTISPNEKREGEKSASLLFGRIQCYYKWKYCEEELVSITNLGEIMMFPHVEKYDIKYRDKDRIIYSDDYKTSVVVDLNQETITKTLTKTFLRETPKTQIDEFITNSEEILKEEKRVIKKHLKKKLW